MYRGIYKRASIGYYFSPTGNAEGVSNAEMNGFGFVFINFIIKYLTL